MQGQYQIHSDLPVLIAYFTTVHYLFITLRLRQNAHDFIFEWDSLNFCKKFTEVCSQCSSWQYSSIGWDNGLAPNMQQAII